MPTISELTDLFGELPELPPPRTAETRLICPTKTSRRVDTTFVQGTTRSGTLADWKSPRMGMASTMGIFQTQDCDETTKPIPFSEDGQ